MDTNKILSSDLLDLVFDDRNKSYGAYELRRTYPDRIKKSLLITFFIAALIFGGALLANTLKPAIVEKPKDTVTMINLTPTVDPAPIPPPQKKADPPPETRAEKLTTMKVVPEDQVDEPPPTQDDLEGARIDLAKRDGVEDVGIAKPDAIPDAKGLLEVKANDDDQIHDFIEVPAKYDGDWEKFLLRNLNGNVPVGNGAEAGRYKVIIQFVVDKEGKVSDLTPLTNMGFGMEKEAMRVLKKADKWKPGIQNGYPVKAYHRQVIVFEVTEG